MTIDADKQNYITSLDATIEEAWTKIESNRHRSVIVIDGNKVVGTLSDGDIRKAMLSRRLLSTPVGEIMNMDFTSLREQEADRADGLFKKKDIFLIPVVDNNLNLVDIIVK